MLCTPGLTRTGVPPPTAALCRLLPQDLPIDLVAGKYDGIIAREDVLTHYERMREGGVSVTYKEFSCGHLDVTFAVNEEVRHYVLSRLHQRQ